jgi:hypothetical protein
MAFLPLTTPPPKMPPQRTALGPISGNTTRGKELTPYARGCIETAGQLGLKPHAIQDLFGASRGAIRTTLTQATRRIEGQSLPRPGRPKVYSEREYRRLLQHIRKCPKDTYQQVRNALELNFSNATIKRYLIKHHIHNWKCKKRPYLSPENALKRYLWCAARRHWGVAEWNKYMWSDECSAERGRGKKQEWCWRTSEQKWNPEMITTYKSGKDIKVMVWGCFWGTEEGTERSELYILNRDFESKKHGYSAVSYLEVLEDQIPKCFQPGMTFMQDNASIHTARVVRQWFADMAIPLTDWPPYSPDLNPIEQVWFHMKAWVMENYPELENASGVSEEDIEKLEKALIKA